MDSKKQPTVFSDERYPQFMTRLPGGEMIPTVPEPPAERVTLNKISRWLFACVR